MAESFTADPSMTTGTVEVTMPSTGSDAQVKVTAWLKHPGDKVAEHEAICIVGWGDHAAEVASPAPGVLRMVTLAAGDRVGVGGTLAVVDVAVTALGAGRFAPDPLRG
jgi:pyruvate/2-oxoglutarate dehydrogenase complex dihydrolipoamide acyltransferase (E2) component